MKQSLSLPAAIASMILAAATAGAQIPGLGRGSSGGGGDRGLGIGSYDTKTVTHERVLSGMVRAKDGTPLKGAVVYLKNEGTKTIKSVTVDATGKFRFIDLSRTVDYELWAVSKEQKTPQKTISQFDTRDQITRELNVE